MQLEKLAPPRATSWGSFIGEKAYESLWPRELAVNCKEILKNWPRGQGDPGWKNTRFKGGITWEEEQLFPVFTLTIFVSFIWD